MPPPHTAGWKEKGFSYLENLKSYWKDDVPPPPSISETAALLFAIGFTLAYIAPFYLSPTLRTSPLNSRDSPAVIAARVRAVTITCLLCAAVTLYVLLVIGKLPLFAAFQLLGVWPVSLSDIAKVLLLCVILFVGPLYEGIIVEKAWKHGLFSLAVWKDYFWDDPRSNRNLVVAPVSEEWVFRSLTLSLYLLARAAPVRTIILKTPLIFGLAHLHHLAEFLQTHTTSNRKLPPLNVVVMGVLRSVFQFSYTSLFGFFAAFVYLRTGSVLAAIVAHSFCNRMGLPRLSGRVGQFDTFELSDMTPDVAQGKRQDGDAKDGPTRTNVGPVSMNLSIGWSVVYYALLLVGAYGFYRTLWVLTESRHALVKI
ncbi:Abi-domain-containing protein [Polychaeton citri CBS 116435]|uniref:intramembrane prenyl-peptidase Rce1 n=1 Tax=Polychaeton citri CBS 116435 TaxID=1314669 RepID=A0A9P4Q7Q1_9PEZI|nr:Abi-domain-containing protein [Polychaeton citri CBS 116435]